MDLNSENVASLLYPIAAIELSSSDSLIDGANDARQLNRTAWKASTLNPKNRINSVTEPLDSKWRVDGSTGMGTHFYTIPVFLQRPLPMRIDTFIPDKKEIPADLHSVLDIGVSFYTRDSRVEQLGIARYIVQVLTRWSEGFQDFETFFNSLPFGSRIVLQNIDVDIRNVRVQVLQTHFLERQLLSAASLQALWKLPLNAWPECIDISEVTLLRQLHDSISLVRFAGQTCIMKSLSSSPKYLYHELKVLLSLAPHPNIISRPSHLVVKRCNFGSKIAVIGFLIEYHSGGALRDVLSFRRVTQTLNLRDQIRWSIQLTEALTHIRDNDIMYCDLRLDNIVLDEKSNRIILVDFEARGVGTFMSAPEVTYLEYIHSLATEAENHSGNSELEECKRLHEMAVSGSSVPATSETYRNPKHGYCVSWLCLNAKERESAQIYMLGKALWGIFEGVGSPDLSILVEHRREVTLQYPEWRDTPEPVRNLITACCSSTRRQERFPLMRRGQTLCLRNSDGKETQEGVRSIVAEWWRAELDAAKEFIQREYGKSIDGERTYDRRPRLDDVLITLKSFAKDMGL